MTPRAKGGRPRGSGHLQQPIEFTLQHSALGNVQSAMSEGAYRTLIALLDRIDEAGEVMTTRALLIQITRMHLQGQSDALRELIDKLGFVEIAARRFQGDSTLYRVRVRQVKKKSKGVNLAYVEGAEPPEITFAHKLYSAMLYLEIPGATEAEVHHRLTQLRKLSPDLEQAKLVNLEALPTDKAG